MYETLVVLASPLIFHQKVTFEDGLNHEVVFLVSQLEQIFLHDRQLGLIDANEAAFGFSDGHLLANLQVAVEQDFLSQRPTDVDAAYQVLCLLRHLRELVHILIGAVSRRVVRLTI